MKCLASNKTLLEKEKGKERLNSIKTIFVSVAMAASDMGLCKNTVVKVLNKAMYYINSILLGYITLSDMETTLAEEYDITFEWVEDKFTKSFR